MKMIYRHWRGLLVCFSIGLGMAVLAWVLGPDDWYQVGVNTDPGRRLGAGYPTYIVDVYRGPQERILRTVGSFFFYGGAALFFFVMDVTRPDNGEG